MNHFNSWNRYFPFIRYDYINTVELFHLGISKENIINVKFSRNELNWKKKQMLRKVWGISFGLNIMHMTWINLSKLFRKHNMCVRIINRTMLVSHPISCQFINLRTSRNSCSCHLSAPVKLTNNNHYYYNKRPSITCMFSLLLSLIRWRTGLSYSARTQCRGHYR